MAAATTQTNDYDARMDAPTENRLEQSDSVLMSAYVAGDAGAFDVIYQRHKNTLYRYMYRQLDNPSTVDELFQDVWSRVIRSRGDFQQASSFSAWLFRIAHNRIVDYYRSEGRKREWFEPIDDADDITNTVQHEPESMAVNSELAQRLKELISDLPPPQRDVFLLKEEAGLSLHEIASVTGSDKETIKRRLRYAVGKLRKQLRNCDD